MNTGAHAASALAVVDGRADIASLDAVTWNLIQRHDAFAANLTVLAKTRPTPGLPFITSAGQNAAEIHGAVKRAVLSLDEKNKNMLQIRDFVFIEPEAYLAEPLPQE